MEHWYRRRRSSSPSKSQSNAMKRVVIMVAALLGLSVAAWARGEYVPPPYGAGLGGIGGWLEPGPVWGWTDPFFGGDPTKPTPPPNGGNSGGRGGWGQEFVPGGGNQGPVGGSGGGRGGDSAPPPPDPQRCFKKGGPGPGPSGASTYRCACITYSDSPRQGEYVVGRCEKEDGGIFLISGCNDPGQQCMVKHY